jgi:hypothetical protein
MTKTNEEKRLALDHLWYEAWMFHESFKRLENCAEQIEFNIFLETFLVHARNLIYFLEDKKYKEDIRCSDFEVEKIIIILPQNISLQKINKFVSHLTWDRIRGTKPEFPPKIILEIKEIINKEIFNFINQLSDNLFPTTKYKKRKTDFNLL